MTLQPWSSVVWLLRRVSSRDAANAAVGDLLDTLAERQAAGHAPRWPVLWINAQTIRLAAAFVVSALPRGWRTAGYTVRDAFRSLRHARAYSAQIVALLAVGIAAGTVTYSVVDAVVLRPLAIEGGERLVRVPTRDDKRKVRIDAQAFRIVHDQVTSLDGVAKILMTTRETVSVGGEPDAIGILSASADLVALLRFRTVLGRTWTIDDEQQGETGVAVISHRYWISRFRGDSNVLGQVIVNGRASYRVVGVLTADADVPGFELSTCDMWVPMKAEETWFGVIGRMRRGATPAQVAGEIQQALGTPDWQPAIVPYLERDLAPVRSWMLLALGAAGIIVLIACVNAANIMLTRSFRRAQELAIRSSLGASRRQIALSVMTEGMILSLAASACALLFSIWGIAAAKLTVTTYLPRAIRASEIALNGRVLAAAMAAAIITGVLSSLVPAWQASRASVSGVMKDAGPTVTGGARSWRSAMLIGEIASVSVLLVASWLFVTSLIRVFGVDLGIDRSQLLAVVPGSDFNGTIDEVRARLESVSGVAGVAIVGTTSLPLLGQAFGGAWITTTVARADAPSEAPPLSVLHYRVTANYFDVAGIRFRRGTSWQEATAFDTPSIVLDDWAAARLFGADDPLGRQLRMVEYGGLYTVIGVVPHVYSRGPETTDEPGVYIAMRPNPTRKYGNLFVRTTRPAEEMAPVLTQALTPFAPQGKGEYIHLADEAVSKITATRRFTGGLMSAFGALAMLIGAAGIYSVIAAVVAQQRREIGVRVALGATPRRIHRSILTLTSKHVVVGLAIGLPLAWWLSRGFAAHLFGVTPNDPSVYLGVAALVAAVSLVAALVPAGRAARTDPMIVLRS